MSCESSQEVWRSSVPCTWKSRTSFSMDCSLEACNDTVNAFHTSNKQWNAYTVSSVHCLLAKLLFRNYKSGHRLLILKYSYAQDKHTFSTNYHSTDIPRTKKKRIKQSQKKKTLKPQLKHAAKATTSSSLPFLRLIHVHVPGSR